MKQNDVLLSPAEYRKREMWEVCNTKEELYWHVKTFLNIDLPKHCVDELSTSNPLDFLWSIYRTMLTNEGDFRHVVATSRNCMKTLCSAIIHFYAMLHFRRDCCQLAATRTQSQACIKYLDKFLMIPEVVDYADINNKEEKMLKNLPANSFTNKPDAKIVVMVATLKGTNSARASCFAGKTEVLVKKKTEIKALEGRYKRISMDGLYKRITKGEQWEAVSINPYTLEIETKPIIAANRRINTERLLITTKSGKQVECTEEHPLAFDYNGELKYKPAKDFLIGDSLYTKHIGSNTQVHDDFIKKTTAKVDFTFDGESFSLTDMIEGTLLGDGCVSRRKKQRLDENGIPFKFYAGNAQLSITKKNTVGNWLEFFKQKLEQENYKPKINDKVYSGYTGEQQFQLVSGMSEKLLKYRNKWYPENKKIVPKDFKLTWHSFAVWLMDDGSKGFRTISSESFTREESAFLANQINELVGFDCARSHDYQKQDGRKYTNILLKWPANEIEVYKKLVKLIHPDYQYKIDKKTRPCKHCGEDIFGERTVVCDRYECRIKEYVKTIVADEIIDIKKKTAAPEKRERWVYDIEVKDNHNFFANSFLAHNCLISDEVELIDPDIMSEAANVADPTMREGFDPISIYLSSRKFAGGPLQSLIDEASDTAKDGTFLHKWSLADFMQKCPTYLHHPELPKIPALIHRDTLEVIWGETAAELENKSTYIEVLAHHGCKTCGAFIACQSRSTKQPSASPSLRTAKFVAGRLRDVKDTKKIISQILNWKPESSGLVFPMFAPSLHVKESKAAYRWITRGTDFNPMNLTEEAYNKCLNSDDPTELKLVTPSKRDLYKILKQHNWKINWGCDWGYTDPAALVIVAYNRREGRAFVLHSELKTGYSNQDWSTFCATNYGTAFAPDLVCPDMADAAAPTYFAKHYLPTRDTKPSRIETGVSQIRSLLWNVSTQEVNFCILDDRLSVDLIEEFQKWTHERTQTGYNFDKYEKDEYNHGLDSIRYSLDPFIAEADIHFAANNRKEVSTEDLFEAARDPNNLDAQIALAKKQMSDHFLKEHGIADLTPRFNIPFAVPLNQASESFTLNKEHIEAGKEGKRKGGIFFRFG